MGIRCVFLEHASAGKTILTSEAALYKSFTELAKARQPLKTDCIITNNFPTLLNNGPILSGGINEHVY
jgi:hypothetical protein